MFCSKCGEKLKKNVKFCGKCGANIVSGEKIKNAEVKIGSFQKDYGYFGYLIDNYISTLKQYAVFKGRTSRIQFWSFILIHFSIISLLIFFFPIIGLIYGLVTFLPLIGSSVRRMHDSNKSAWFTLVPFYNILLEGRQGDEGKNSYGESINDEYNDINFLIPARTAILSVFLGIITLFSSDTNGISFLDRISILLELVILIGFLRIASILKLRYLIIMGLFSFIYTLKVLFYTGDGEDINFLITLVLWLISVLLFGTSIFTLISGKLKTIPILLGITHIIMFFALIVLFFISANGGSQDAVMISEKVLDVIGIILSIFTAILFFQLNKIYDKKKISL